MVTHLASLRRLHNVLQPLRPLLFGDLACGGSQGHRFCKINWTHEAIPIERKKCDDRCKTCPLIAVDEDVILDQPPAKYRIEFRDRRLWLIKVSVLRPVQRRLQQACIPKPMRAAVGIDRICLNLPNRFCGKEERLHLANSLYTSA